MNMLKTNVKTLTIPEIAIIAATRGAIGFGAGLLLADKFRQTKRKTLGWSLFLTGLASTIPIAMHVFRKTPVVKPASPNSLVRKSISLLENITQPPFMFFMKLHMTREEIDRARIILFVGGSGSRSHLLDN